MCGAEFSSEPLVRTHIALADDSEHDTRSGYMPEDEVLVLDETGSVVETRSGGGFTSETGDISSEELPEGLDQYRTQLIRTAAENTNVDTFQELVDRVNGAYQMKGLKKRSYTFVKNNLDDFFELSSQEDSETTIEDLTSKQRRVIEARRENPSMGPTELAEEADVDPSYPGRVLDEFSDLVTEEESEEEETTEDETVDETVDETDVSQEEVPPAESDVYDTAQLTDIQQEVVEYIAHNPGATNKEVADAVGCARSYPSDVRGSHKDVIIARVKEVAGDLSKLEESQKRRKQKQAKSWGDLTDKQQAILRELAKEDNPRDPDSSLQDIIDQSDIDTHRAYAKNIGDNKSDFAVRLKAAKRMSSADQDPEDVVDSISTEQAEKAIEQGTEKAASTVVDEETINGGVTASDNASDVREETTDETAQKAINSLSNVNGIGEQTAEELYEEYDITSQEQLADAVEKGTGAMDAVAPPQRGNVRSALNPDQDEDSGVSQEPRVQDELPTATKSDIDSAIADEADIESVLEIIEAYREDVASELEYYSDRPANLVGKLVMVEQIEDDVRAEVGAQE